MCQTQGTGMDEGGGSDLSGAPSLQPGSWAPVSSKL